MQLFRSALCRGNSVLIAVLFMGGIACSAGSVAAQEAMTVDPTGNVGIGTSLPEAHVHVQGSGGQVFLIETTDTAVADISLKNPANLWGFRVNTAGNFSIVDRTATTLVMTIEKQSPLHSMYIDSTGNIGMGGITAPPRRLTVVDTSLDGPVLRLQDANTVCDLDPAPGEPVWTCPSDLRLKTNVRPADTAAILKSLEGIQLFEYQLASTGENHVGPVAQQLRENHPERVTEADDGTLMVSLPGRTELLGAIQELRKMVVELGGRVEGLQRELEAARCR